MNVYTYVIIHTGGHVSGTLISQLREPSCADNLAQLDFSWL